MSVRADVVEVELFYQANW